MPPLQPPPGPMTTTGKTSTMTTTRTATTTTTTRTKKSSKRALVASAPVGKHSDSSGDGRRKEVAVGGNDKDEVTPAGKKKTRSKPTKSKRGLRGVFHKAEEIVNPRMVVDKRVVDELLLVCGVIGTTTLDAPDPNNDNAAEEEAKDRSRRILSSQKRKSLSVGAPTIVPVADCLNWLQDLQRALRRDDDTYRPISLLLGKWKVVSQKLFPLVMACRYDTPLVLTVVKILVILTKPLHPAALRASSLAAINVKDAALTPEVLRQQQKIRENAVAQSEQLMEYKRLFVHHASHQVASKNGGLLSILVSLLVEPLSRTGTARTDSDHMTIELVLHLLRNLLGAAPLAAGMEESARRRHDTLHHDLIALLERELVLDILLVLGQDLEANENSAYNLLTMEILHNLLRSQDPTLVAQSAKRKPMKTPAPSKVAKTTMSSSLLQERQHLQASASSRHALFGGTLMVMKPNGSRQYISASSLHLPPHAPTTAGPVRRKHRKMEPFVVVGDTTTLGCRHSRRLSPVDPCPSHWRAQRALHSFCGRFLARGYGPTMKSLKNEFRRESARLETSDRAVFFRLVWFFCQWWRTAKEEGTLPPPKRAKAKKESDSETDHDDDDDDEPPEETEEDHVTNDGTVGPLIFTMDVFTFNLVLTSMDSFASHKRPADLATTVALYCEMMHILKALHSSVDETEQVMSLGLLDRLFYSHEPLDRLHKILSQWTPGTNSREYLCHVVEIVHLTLHLLEHNGRRAALAVEHGGAVVPQKNKRRKNKDMEWSSGNVVQRMNAVAAEFEVPVYVARRIVSHHVVQLYTTLLSHYKWNAPRVNEQIVSFFVRLCKFVVRKDDDDDDLGKEELRGALSQHKTTSTLEPLLYNVQTFLVLHQILQDQNLSSSSSSSRDSEALLSFATVLVRHYATAAKANPLLFVETLFRPAGGAPHRFCDLVTHFYVTEELQLLAERDVLLWHEEQSSQRAADGPTPHDDEGEMELVDREAETDPRLGENDKGDPHKEHEMGQPEPEEEEKDDDNEGDFARRDSSRKRQGRSPEMQEDTSQGAAQGATPSEKRTLDEKWNHRRAFVPPKRKRETDDQQDQSARKVKRIVRETSCHRRPNGTLEDSDDDDDIPLRFDKSQSTHVHSTTTKKPLRIKPSPRNRLLTLQDSDDDDDDTQMLLEKSRQLDDSHSSETKVEREQSKSIETSKRNGSMAFNDSDKDDDDTQMLLEKGQLDGPHPSETQVSKRNRSMTFNDSDDDDDDTQMLLDKSQIDDCHPTETRVTRKPSRSSATTNNLDGEWIVGQRVLDADRDEAPTAERSILDGQKEAVKGSPDANTTMLEDECSAPDGNEWTASSRLVLDEKDNADPDAGDDW